MAPDIGFMDKHHQLVWEFHHEVQKPGSVSNLAIGGMRDVEDYKITTTSNSLTAGVGANR